MLLAHQDVENTAKKYYLNGVSSYDMSGIIFGEITAGNKDHAKVRRASLGWHAALTILFHLCAEGTCVEPLPTTSTTAFNAGAHGQASGRDGDNRQWG